MAQYSDEEIIQAFKDFNDVWKISRSGLIISLTGARAGTWTWQSKILTVNAEDETFKKDLRQLVKQGIIVRELTLGFTGSEDDIVKSGDASTLKIVPVSQAYPGQLDSALKVMGYFMLETSLGLNAKGEG